MRKFSTEESERLAGLRQPPWAAWKSVSGGWNRTTTGHGAPAPRRHWTGVLGMLSHLASQKPYGMGFILLFYRWKK